MDFLKNFLKNDKTVVGLCDLKRREAINSFNFARYGSFNRTPSFSSVYASDIPGGLVYAK